MATTPSPPGRSSIRFDLDVGRPDDRPPLLDLGLVVSGERRRRLLLALRDHLAEIGEPLPDYRIGQGVYDRAVELDDDLLGRALLHPQAVPERDVHPRRADLIRGRDIG